MKARRGTGGYMHNDPKFPKSLTPKQWAIVLAALDDANEDMADAYKAIDDEDELRDIAEDRAELQKIILALTL